MRLESNDSSQLMSTCHTGSRFARQLRKYSASNYEGALKMLSNRLDSTRIEQLVTVDVDLSYRKTICKTLPKFSASGRERGLQILSNRLDSNDSSQLTGNSLINYLTERDGIVLAGYTTSQTREPWTSITRVQHLSFLSLSSDEKKE